MRQVRRIGVCALAAVMLGLLVGVATASAYSPTGVPEIGRCLSTPGIGGFKGGKCITHSPTHKGNFEWSPGPGANGAVKLALTALRFETVNGKQIDCDFLFAKGELTGGKTLKLSEVELQGCALAGEGLACYSVNIEPNRVISNTALVGELGFIPGSRVTTPWVGWDLKAESQLSPTMLEFKCGEAGGATPAPPIYEVSLEGSVIGRVRPTNQMIANGVFALVYKQEKGIQKPIEFIGGPEDFLTQITTPILSPLNKKTEQAGFQGGGEMKFGEAMEIKATQH